MLLFKKNFNSLYVLSEFLVDTESLIIKLILVLLSNLCEFLSIIIVKTVDIVHHSALIGLDSCQDKKVLEVSIVVKARVVKNNSF